MVFVSLLRIWRKRKYVVSPETTEETPKEGGFFFKGYSFSEIVSFEMPIKMPLKSMKTQHTYIDNVVGKLEEREVTRPKFYTPKFNNIKIEFSRI